MRARLLGLACLLTAAAVLGRGAEGEPPAGNGGDEHGEVRNEPYEYAFVTINGRPITRSYLALRAAPKLKEFRAIKAQRQEKGLWSERDERQLRLAIAKLNVMAVRGVIFGEVLRAEAERFVKMGFKVPEREVESHYRQMLEGAGGAASVARQQGLSVAAIREMARDDILAEAYRQNLRATVARPTPREVAEFYKYHSEELRLPESVRARVIFVRRFIYDEKTGRKLKRETAGARAEEILARLRAGEDFAKLARRFSEDAASAADGGLLGKDRTNHLVGRGQFEKVLEDALFSLKPGELSEVLEGPANYYVVEVLVRLPAGVPPLEEVEDQVRDLCYRERIQQAEEDLFRSGYHKVLVVDAKGRRVPIEEIWPEPAKKPRGSLFRDEDEGEGEGEEEESS